MTMILNALKQTYHYRNITLVLPGIAVYQICLYIFGGLILSRSVFLTDWYVRLTSIFVD